MQLERYAHLLTSLRSGEALSEVAALARRLGRHLASRLLPPRAFLVYHPDYEPPDQPFSDPQRAARILLHLHRQGCITTRHVRRAPRPSLASICRVHGRDYVASLQDPAVVERIFGMPVAEPFAEAAMRQQRRMVGGTVRAADHAVTDRRPGRPVINLGGGFHHAYAEQGTGFCAFNDVAIAIADLRERGFDGRILVLDLDLHQGDGTRHIFARDDSVFTCSVHAVDWYNGPAVADLNVALGPGIGDRSYLRALTEVIPEAFSAANPDLVFYLAGVDVADDDQLGNWWVSPEGIFLRDEIVADAIGQRPSVWLLAGGYGSEAWRHSARTIGWLLSGLDESIDSSHELSLARFRRLSERLDVAALTQAEAAFDLSEADLVGDLYRQPQHFKLLGLYTPHGVECALERYGVLEKVRQLGYSGFDVSFDLEHPTGQLLRIHSDDQRHDLLLESVLRVDHSHAPYRLLSVEWLLMQNPRAQPTPDRPLLPGQKHPGLGVLDEVGLMLVMVCERLGFDGLLFNPAHYHLAAQARGRLLFLDPEVQGRFLAMGSAVEGESLIDATRLFARGLTTNRLTGLPVRWTPAPMVLPVSERIKDTFEGVDYEKRVEAAAAGYDIDIHPERLHSGRYRAIRA